jgi:hypothetical protein
MLYRAQPSASEITLTLAADAKAGETHQARSLIMSDGMGMTLPR